jgi:hypothetical protein
MKSYIEYNAIGDTPIDGAQKFAADQYEPPETNDNLPGVHLPEPDESAKISGVGSTDQDLYDNVPDLVDAFGGDDDFNIQAEPQDLVQEGNKAPNPGMGDTLVGGTGYVPGVPTGVRRLTRENKQVKQWQPSMTGQRYVFAAMALVTTQLGQLLLSDDSYQHNADVAYAFMQQLSLKSALKQFGTDAKDAGVKKVSQLHWRDNFVPRRYSDLTDGQEKKVLKSHMFLVKKRDDKTKARMVADGNNQRDYMMKEDLSSPTVSTEAVLLTSIVDAHEGQDVAVIDIPNAFIQTRIDNPKD